MPKFDRIDIVKAEDGFPFYCALCHREDRQKDYIRFFEEKDKNGFCIHNDCLVKLLDLFLNFLVKGGTTNGPTDKQ